MPQHEIPNSHLELLQSILKLLIQAQDPDATFVIEKIEQPEKAKEVTIGQ